MMRILKGIWLMIGVLISTAALVYIILLLSAFLIDVFGAIMTDMSPSVTGMEYFTYHI